MTRALDSCSHRTTAIDAAQSGPGSSIRILRIQPDGDGIDDLLISFGSGGRYGWLRNQGGMFGPLSSFFQLPSARTTPLIGDFDSDGNLDLAAVSSLGLWLHQGTGALGTAAFGEGSRLTIDIA